MRSQKAQAALWCYYVQPQPMCSQASHTACAAYAFKIGDFKSHYLYAAKLRKLLAQPMFFFVDFSI